MWNYRLFRIGAGVLVVMGLVQLAGHFAMKGVVPSNGTEITLHDMMYNYKTEMTGTMRSTGDLYDGFSLAFAICMLALGALAFVVPVQRKPAGVMAVSLLVLLVISVSYWFAIPTFFLAVTAAMFGGAALLNR